MVGQAPDERLTGVRFSPEGPYVPSIIGQYALLIESGPRSTRGGRAKNSFLDRLTAGQQTLTLFMLVRIQLEDPLMEACQRGLLGTS